MLMNKAEILILLVFKKPKNIIILRLTFEFYITDFFLEISLNFLDNLFVCF